MIKAGVLHQETVHQGVIVIGALNSPPPGGVQALVDQGRMIGMVQGNQEAILVLEGTTGKGCRKRTQIFVTGIVS